MFFSVAASCPPLGVGGLGTSIDYIFNRQPATRETVNGI